MTETLLARDAALHAALPPALWHPRHRPSAWVPHVMLHQGGHVPLPERMIARLASLWAGPIAGTADRVEPVCFPSPTALWSTALRDAAPEPP